MCFNWIFHQWKFGRGRELLRHTHIENEGIAQKILINPFFAGGHIWRAMFNRDYHISQIR